MLFNLKTVITNLIWNTPVYNIYFCKNLKYCLLFHSPLKHSDIHDDFILSTTIMTSKQDVWPLAELDRFIYDWHSRNHLIETCIAGRWNIHQTNLSIQIKKYKKTYIHLFSECMHFWQTLMASLQSPQALVGWFLGPKINMVPLNHISKCIMVLVAGSEGLYFTWILVHEYWSVQWKFTCNVVHHNLNESPKYKRILHAISIKLSCHWPVYWKLQNVPWKYIWFFSIEKYKAKGRKNLLGTKDGDIY